MVHSSFLPKTTIAMNLLSSIFPILFLLPFAVFAKPNPNFNTTNFYVLGANGTKSHKCPSPSNQLYNPIYADYCCVGGLWGPDVLLKTNTNDNGTLFNLSSHLDSAYFLTVSPAPASTLPAVVEFARSVICTGSLVEIYRKRAGRKIAAATGHAKKYSVEWGWSTVERGSVDPHDTDSGIGTKTKTNTGTSTVEVTSRTGHPSPDSYSSTITSTMVSLTDSSPTAEPSQAAPTVVSSTVEAGIQASTPLSSGVSWIMGRHEKWRIMPYALIAAVVGAWNVL